jgi:peptidoglycan/xylan/chitin deacetylase (PgdA/CDA1 family)
VLLLVSLVGCGSSKPTPKPKPAPKMQPPAPVPRQAHDSSPTRHGLPGLALVRVRAGGRVLTQLPTRRHIVALTFDAGAGDQGLPKILAALRASGAPGTFFVTGRFVQHYPEQVREIGLRYPIGNHTYDHRQLPAMAPQDVRGELERAQALINADAGSAHVSLFRFPYGASSVSSLGVVDSLGYTAVGWTVDTLGWEGTSLGQSRAGVVRRALRSLRPGEIILMHVGANPTDGSTLDADALPTIIRLIKQRGYTFVALSGSP